MIRILDIVISLFGLILFSPVLIVIGITIKLFSNGPCLFTQERVGLNGKVFNIYKYRTMLVNSNNHSQITISDRDPRVTKIGFLLRKFKLDELPQLFNVLMGDMSIVGPRPEVPKYVKLYNPSQRRVLTIAPGITDWASIYYRDEATLLGKSSNPEYEYVNKIMVHKLDINLRYINNYTVFEYFKVLIATIFYVFYKVK